MQRRLKFLLFPMSEYECVETGKYLNVQLFEELKRRWPRFFPPGLTGFNFDSDESDPVYEEVTTFLRQHGREPYRSRYPTLVHKPELRLTHYQVEGVRIFEAKDYTDAKFFRCSGREEIAEEGRRGPDGVFQIPKEEINDEVIGGLMSSDLPICRDSLKCEMENERFGGLVFNRVNIVGEGAEHEPLWELSSDRHMPAVRNRLINKGGERFDPARDRDCWPEDFYNPWLLRFPASEVEAMGSFDAALTEERFNVPLDYVLVVSRTFRDWCESRKLKLNWYPVAIE